VDIIRYDAPINNLKNLLEYINETRGIDFSLYRQATIRRKLAGRMQETGNNDLREYLDYLRSHPQEMQNIVAALTIKVSNFFRNPLVFELLFSNILPELINDFRFINAWSIGCANAEEPYSLAIILRELLKKENNPVTVRIQGTDIDSKAIENALKGVYPGGELEDVKKKYMDSFFENVPKPHEEFTGGEQSFRIKYEIKEMVSLECDDIITRLKTKTGRYNHYNLIFCRNMLIYLNRPLQEEILLKLMEMLYENGYLIIGASETLPEPVKQHFVQPFPGVKIYKKKFQSPKTPD
jgi:chemotaxis methyl-accepting protein methylase